MSVVKQDDNKTILSAPKSSDAKQLVQSYERNSQMIRTYARNEAGNPVGMVVAVKDNDRVSLGWSKCNKVDVFDKQFGTFVALQRALHSKGNVIVPNKVRRKLTAMRERAAKYFKVPVDTVQ